MKLFKQYFYLHLISVLLLLVMLSACSSTNYTTAVSDEQVEASDAEQRPDDYIYSLFLMGDAGDATMNPLSGTLKVMSEKLAEVDSSGAVVILGDNIYPDGLPPESSERRPEIDERLLAQIETVKEFGGPVYFLPGNHDWASSGEEGLEYVNRQESFVEEYMGRGNTFLPDDGYPGPVSVTLVNKNEDAGINYTIGLIMMDTHWWIHPHEKPLPYGAETEEQAKKLVLKELNESRANLKMIHKAKLHKSPTQVQSAIEECIELIKIFQASIQTARKRT